MHPLHQLQHPHHNISTCPAGLIKRDITLDNGLLI
jgi:hypothetical protein